MTLIMAVHNALKAVAPISGVSEGADDASWEIQFAPEATEAQRAAAQEVLASFDFDAARARVEAPPIETTKLRFALELKARGMWPAVKAAIAANEDATMYWDFTDIVRSDNQMLLALAGQMGVSAAEVRAIITAAIARQV